ncbi:unnamed protein product [Plutella xylostella]|uniref:Aminopeptidase n=1 Tax=Plutella xylostella TaxID=51655 RepID=A0A8S4G593_PLUXY|nr:unnamed protein product [Plutella xylostella]
MFRVTTVVLSILLFDVALTDHPAGTDRNENVLSETDLRDELSRDSEYRLPVDVVPIEYDIDLDLNFVATDDRPAYSYNGIVNIIVQAVDENIKQIVLHANIDRIKAITVLTSAGKPMPLNPNSPFVIEPLYHFLRINMLESLKDGDKYLLRIEYSSTMNDGPLRRGIWKGHYKDNGGIKRTYATTHFQPYNARQAFPCWDEPMFKAEFKLHLTRPSNFNAVFTNTELESTETLSNNWVRDTFKTTPKMSSYLLTFLASESFQVIAEDTSFDPPIRLIGRSNTAGLGAKALKFAVGVARFFDEYFGMPYNTLNPNLNNDHISSPDWASAGTENWGMVSYRELYMIMDSDHTIMSVEHYAATLISHELAHKWFGNLVTCAWWSETWINEGFASYFGYLPNSIVFPEYEHDEHFNSRYLQTSLSVDSAVSTTALRTEVNTPAQVTGNFGTISYSKGAAFLRMLSDMITPETFQKACRYFLLGHAYESAYHTDLYYAFKEAIEEDGTLNGYEGFDFYKFYDTWVNEPGYPIIEVEIDYVTGEMQLKQERFLLSASATPVNPDVVYPIPITFSSKNNQSFTELKPIYMMSAKTGVVSKQPGEEWVIFNHLQHGHYRVNYERKNWELIAEALKDESQPIHHLNRAQIVDDMYAFMRSERIAIEYGFKVLRFLNTETNYHVWNPAITMFSFYRNRLRFTPEYDIFTSFVLETMEHAIKNLGYDVKPDESSTTSLHRQEMLQFACNLGHEQCIKESKERFNSFKDGSKKLDPRISRHVYTVGIREGDIADFEFLLTRFLESNFANEKLEMLRGLAATRNPTLINRYLQLTLTEDIRTQDKSTAFNYVLSGNLESASTVLEFIKNNIDTIREVFQEDAPNNPVNSVISNVASYLDEEGLNDYENWLRTTQSGSAQFNTGINAIRSARNNIAWGAANAEAIIAATKDGAAQIVASVTLMILLAMITLIV